MPSFLSETTAMAPARLHRSAGSPEPRLLTYAIKFYQNLMNQFINGLSNVIGEYR